MKKSYIYYALMVLSALVLLASWILNMGWYRFVFTIIPIPLMHTVAYLIINIKAIRRSSSFQGLDKYIILSAVSYMLSYSLFPDDGDIGETYFFFGLIHNDAIADIMMYVACIGLIANVALLVLECIQLKKCKNQQI